MSAGSRVQKIQSIIVLVEVVVNSHDGAAADGLLGRGAHHLIGAGREPLDVGTAAGDMGVRADKQAVSGAALGVVAASPPVGRAVLAGPPLAPLAAAGAVAVAALAPAGVW